MALHLNYGGTFDPIHAGHLAVARSAAEQLGAVVHLVPCADPPHRQRPVANAAQRAQMVALAIRDQPLLALDRRELRRDGATYTVDTLRELRAELGPDASIGCLVGADAFAGLPTWRDWRALFQLAHLVALTRPGHPLDRLPDELEQEIASRRVHDPSALHAAPAGLVLELAVPAWDVSSTRVRAMLAAGEVPDGLVPAAVVDWLRLNAIYGPPLRVR